MPRRSPPPSSRTLLFALAVVATGAACSVRTGATPTSCTEDVECPADAHCHQSTCTADRPPLAAITGPHAAVTGAALTFDGTASSDGDDDVVGWTWSVRVVAASCPPDLGAAAGASFHPVFGCPGEFEVILVVRDRTGVLSEPAVAPVTITGG